MAEVAVLAPATHSQPSRKGKKAWRKNVDITEVQTGLDNVREEIIRGGVIAEKSADELFVVDALGDEDVKSSQQVKKLLRADEILAQRSAVPGLNGKKRRLAEVAVPTSSKRTRNGQYVSNKELQRLKRFAGNDPDAVELESATHDPWAAAAPGLHDHLDFVKKPEPAREPKTLKHAPAALTTSGQAVPALRKPQGGKSYNPLVDDWSDLLQREGQSAVESEEKRLAAEATAEEKQRRAEEEAAKVEAAEQEEWKADYESDWDGFMSENEQQSFTAKQQRRKTPAERNKVKARKQREAQEKMHSKQKHRDEQVKRITEIAREMSAKDKAKFTTALELTNASSDSDDTAEPALAKTRFGKVAVPEAPLEVVLPEELQDSLRRLKPEGNLMTDRYRNILINGKMEVRKRRGQAKKAKTKPTEKWTYKDWKLR